MGRTKKDKNRRKLVARYEVRRRILKHLIYNVGVPLETRMKLVGKLNSLPRNSSRVRVVNRCILTGRSHSVYRFCHLSRIKFRELASQGLLPGVTKTSW
uniref:Ribosomal protein S14 n=1 Tax=Chloropicon sp. RCC4434 TaxID=2565277 RepID=A0A4D6C594_9CHLO|nr:ribosomal protein S14 [Chloropicon sp. RCC4434]